MASLCSWHHPTKGVGSCAGVQAAVLGCRQQGRQGGDGCSCLSSLGCPVHPGFLTLTPSHGMSVVSLNAVPALKPPQEALNPLRTDSCLLLPPTLALSTLSATPHPGRFQQDEALQAVGRASCILARGSHPAQRLSSPSWCLVLLPAAQSLSPCGSGSLSGRRGPPNLGKTLTPAPVGLPLARGQGPWAQGAAGGAERTPSRAAGAGKVSFFNGNREYPTPTGP